MKRLSLKIVGSFLGNVLIITDNETGKSIEAMAAQVVGADKSNKTMGSIPHGGWDKEGDKLTFYHDEDRENHEVTFTMDELGELL